MEENEIYYCDWTIKESKNVIRSPALIFYKNEKLIFKNI